MRKWEYANIAKSELTAIAKSIAARKKDAVLNVRVNSRDLVAIKQRSQRLGIKYQTFISEVIHRIAYRVISDLDAGKMFGIDIDEKAGSAAKRKKVTGRLLK